MIPHGIFIFEPQRHRGWYSPPLSREKLANLAQAPGVGWLLM